LTKKETYAVKFARKGGKARAKNLTPEQRKEIARKASKARWAKWKAAHKAD
jgi:general stress protein YciG